MTDLDALAKAQRDVEALTIALHDAICRPMGVVPASAEAFYQPRLADQAEARRITLTPAR